MKLKMQICSLITWLIINALLSIITKNSSVLSVTYKSLHVPSNIEHSPFKYEKQGLESGENKENLLKNTSSRKFIYKTKLQLSRYKIHLAFSCFTSGEEK